MGGYGRNYVKAVLEAKDILGIECVGMVDIRPENCTLYSRVLELGIPVYASVEELYEHCSPELVFISSPIHFHCAQACFCMEHGSHVLCEKPAAAVIEQVRMMEEVSQKTGKFLAVGFQRSFAEPILRVKKDILAGKYGEPVRFKSGISSCRDLKYYARGWAGKIKAGEEFVYDSIANNAAAHQLQILLFMAGDSLTGTAWPLKAEAELYRVNDIENFDTISTKILTDNQVEIFFVATHGADKNVNFGSRCVFEHGAVCFGDQETVWAEMPDGSRIDYGSGGVESLRKIRCAVDAVRGMDTIFCDIHTAAAHTECIRLIQDNAEIIDLQHRMELRNNAPASAAEPVWQKYVPGLTEAVTESYNSGKMLSQTLFHR